MMMMMMMMMMITIIIITIIICFHHEGERVMHVCIRWVRRFQTKREEQLVQTINST